MWLEISEHVISGDQGRNLMASEADPEFWKNGIRFECQGSGRCCMSRGEYGYVYVEIEDRRRMAKHLGMATSVFTKKYCTQAYGHYHLNDPDQDCQFLKGAKCGVYEARPTQCRTWPFWPENMNAKTWKTEIKSFCPGVDRGRVYSREEIELILEEQASAERDLN